MQSNSPNFSPALASNLEVIGPGQVLVPKRAGQIKKTTIWYGAYMILVIGLLFVLGYGESTEAGYLIRLFSTLVICSPILLLGAYRPHLGLELFVLALLPLKILVVHQYITTSSFHMLTFGLGLLALRLPILHRSHPGKLVFITLSYFCALQALRAYSLPQAAKEMLDLMDFFIVFYLFMPRLTREQIIRLALAFCVGNFICCSLILLLHDWTLSSRLGATVLMNANNIGISAAISMILWSYLRGVKRLGVFPVLFYCIMLVTIFLAASRVSILISTTVILIFSRRSKLSLVFVVLMLMAGGYFFRESIMEDNATTHHMTKGLSGDVELENLSAIRVQLYQRCLELAAEHPFFGVGFTNVAERAQVLSPTTARPLKPHNIYLSLWVETGPLGILMLLMWITTILKRKNGLLGTIITGCFLLIGITHGNFYHVGFAIPWSVALALRNEELQTLSRPKIWRLQFPARARVKRRFTRPAITIIRVTQQLRQGMSLGTSPGFIHRPGR